MDAQTLKRLKNISFYVGLALLVPGVIGMAKVIYDNQVAQRELLTRVRNLDAALLRGAELLPGHETLAVEACLIIEDSIELQELVGFFSHAEDVHPGSQPTEQFRFRLYLHFRGAKEEKYLIRRFERIPDDVYLNVYDYKTYPNGSFSYSRGRLLRIPGLYPWLHDRAVAAGCSTK